MFWQPAGVCQAAPGAAALPLAGASAARRSWRALQVFWFSFLPMADLAECSAVCKSWLVYVNKAYAAEYAAATGVPAPMMLPRLDKLRLLRRVRKPLAREHFSWLLTMAAGRAGEGVWQRQQLAPPAACGEA